MPPGTIQIRRFYNASRALARGSVGPGLTAASGKAGSGHVKYPPESSQEREPKPRFRVEHEAGLAHPLKCDGIGWTWDIVTVMAH